MVPEDLRSKKNKDDKREAVIGHIVKYRLFRDSRIFNSFQTTFLHSLGELDSVTGSKSMWEVIYFLCGAHLSNKSVSVSEVYHSIDVSKTATIACLTNLEKMGAVKKVADPDDRRRKLIQLTPRCASIILEFVDDCVDQFSDPLGHGDKLELETSGKLLEQHAKKSLQIASATSDWFWELDKDLKFTWFSDDFEEKTGLRAEDLLGKTRWQIFVGIPESDLPEYWAEHRQTMLQCQPFRDFSYQYTAPSGDTHHIYVSGTPTFDDQGKFTGYVGSTCNVTDAKQARTPVQENDEKFREFAQLSSDWFWETNASHEFTWFSEEMTEQTGLESFFRTGMRRWDLHAPTNEQERLSMQQHRQDLEHHLPFRNFVYRSRRKGGEFAWQSISGNPRFDVFGNFAGYRGVTKDITDQKRVELARQVDEVRWGLLSDLSSVWCWEIDADLKFTWASIGYWERTGDSLDYFIGSTRWERFHPVTEEEAHRMEAHKHTLMQRRPFRNFVYREVYKEGGEIWYNVSGTPVFDNDGTFTGYHGVAFDCTKHQRRILLSREQKTVMERILKKHDIGDVIAAITKMYSSVVTNPAMIVLKFKAGTGETISGSETAINIIKSITNINLPLGGLFELNTVFTAANLLQISKAKDHVTQLAQSETHNVWVRSIDTGGAEPVGAVIAVTERTGSQCKITRDAIEISADLTGIAMLQHETN
jgi:PAS domain S-box-containing protein